MALGMRSTAAELSGKPQSFLLHTSSALFLSHFLFTVRSLHPIVAVEICPYLFLLIALNVPCLLSSPLSIRMPMWSDQTPARAHPLVSLRGQQCQRQHRKHPEHAHQQHGIMPSPSVPPHLTLPLSLHASHRPEREKTRGSPEMFPVPHTTRFAHPATGSQQGQRIKKEKAWLPETGKTMHNPQELTGNSSHSCAGASLMEAK